MDRNELGLLTARMLSGEFVLRESRDRNVRWRCGPTESVII